MDYKFFAIISRMKHIKRWSLMRSVVEENIMEHSQEVAVIAHALAMIKNKMFGGNVDEYKVLCLAQYHEVSEVLTGDLPTPIKYFNKEIQTAYKELECHASHKLLKMLPEELKQDYQAFILPSKDSEEYSIMKYADKLSAYIKCIEEIRMGNADFYKAKQRLQAEIESITASEVKYFYTNIIPTYEMTLDEVNE